MSTKGTNNKEDKVVSVPDHPNTKMELKVTSTASSSFTLVDDEKTGRCDDLKDHLNNSIDERNCSSPLSEDIPISCGPCLRLDACNLAPQDGPVYFFDLDNTLYPKSSGIAELMVQRIELFFVNYLKLPIAESKVLGARFYRDYGLAIKGLIRHFCIDPVEYDRFVDGGLPLDTILKPEYELISLMDRLSRRGACWVFTNAGRSHAERVIKLLQIETFFSGVIYCDYSEPNFPAKPDRIAFARAMQCARVSDPKKCYFFDDSIGNIRTAQDIGWNVVYVDEDAVTGHSSKDEINASFEILTADPQEQQNAEQQNEEQESFPTIQRIEEVEPILANK